MQRNQPNVICSNRRTEWFVLKFEFIHMKMDWEWIQSRLTENGNYFVAINRDCQTNKRQKRRGNIMKGSEREMEKEGKWAEIIIMVDDKAITIIAATERIPFVAM